MRVKIWVCSMILALGCKPEPEPAASPEASSEAAAESAPESTAEPAAEPTEPARIVVEAGPDGDGQATYRVEIPTPTHAPGAGPRVALDVGHHNFAMPQNYAAFAEALEADGFVVSTLDRPFDAEALAALELLVIVNPLHASNVQSWRLPTPSAFTSAEIDAVEAWVRAGGALWLIADHMPFPGAAAELAGRFGFTLNNGFAFRSPAPGTVTQELIRFRRDEGTIIAGHPITDGLEQLQSFTGEAFEAPPEATALFVMPADGIALMPEVAWEFGPDMSIQAIGGWPVAAVRELERGRVAVFGEAAMLSARYVEVGQTGEWVAVGLHHPEARDNLALVLATARWLTVSSQP